MGNFAENLNLGNRFRPPPPAEVDLGKVGHACLLNFQQNFPCRLTRDFTITDFKKIKNA